MAAVARPRPRASNGHDLDGAAPERVVPLTPLRVSGLVVHKDDLVATLRTFVPELIDIAVDESGQHFWLLLGGEVAHAGQAAR